MDELLTPSEMALADALAISGGTAGVTLMERAGRGVAEFAGQMTEAGASVLVLCGPGNNGGDGFVVARVLAGRGYRVRLALIGDIAALKGDAAKAATGWDGPILSFSDVTFDGVDLVIDAMFGAGLQRDIDGEAKRVITALNAAQCRVIAVDLPSGIDGNNGQIRGVAVEAERTVTFFRKKPAHLLYPARRLCGEIDLVDIGIPVTVLDVINPTVFENSPARWAEIFVPPKIDGHKFDRGHVVVVSGHRQSTGAARLAASAAARVGAGLVTVASPTDALAINAAALTDIMVKESDGGGGLSDLLADQRKNTVVIGPGSGVGAETCETVAVALQSKRAVVLDADALTSFAAHPERLKVLVEEHGAGAVIATPHDGEFSRLFSGMPDILNVKGRLARARAAAAYLGLVIVLKGPDTVIAAPDGAAAINSNGTPWLATAGSGDVLSGLCAGLMARGIPAFKAAAAAVWLHAEAGKRLGAGLVAHDLADEIRLILGERIAV